MQLCSDTVDIVAEAVTAQLSLVWPEIISPLPVDLQELACVNCLMCLAAQVLEVVD